MRERIQQYRDLLLLLWLLLTIVAYPLLDHSTGLRLIRGGMTFVLLIIAIVTS